MTSVKSDPFFGRILTYAYQSSVWQLAAAILLLGFTRRSARLDMLSLSFMISASITIAVWVLFPSFGALPLHYAQGLPDPAFDLVMSKKEAMQQLALHAGPVPPLRFGDLMGLIGCPSFHGVMAVLTVRALFGLPFSGPLALAANIPVMLSIPADGGHTFRRCGRRNSCGVSVCRICQCDPPANQIERHQGLASRGALTLVRQALHLGKI